MIKIIIGRSKRMIFSQNDDLKPSQSFSEIKAVFNKLQFTVGTVQFAKKWNILTKNNMKTFLPLAISITIIMDLINFRNLFFGFFFGDSIFGKSFGWII